MVQYKNNILMIGCGSIGQALLPLLFNIFPILPAQFLIISADDNGRYVADKFGARYFIHPLTSSNYHVVLDQYLHAGDMLINLSVNVSSLALIVWCKAKHMLYLEAFRNGFMSFDHHNPLVTKFCHSVKMTPGIPIRENRGYPWPDRMERARSARTYPCKSLNWRSS